MPLALAPASAAPGRGRNCTTAKGHLSRLPLRRGQRKAATCAKHIQPQSPPLANVAGKRHGSGRLVSKGNKAGDWVCTAHSTPRPYRWPRSSAPAPAHRPRPRARFPLPLAALPAPRARLNFIRPVADNARARPSPLPAHRRSGRIAPSAQAALGWITATSPKPVNDHAGQPIGFGMDKAVMRGCRKVPRRRVSCHGQSSQRSMAGRSAPLDLRSIIRPMILDRGRRLNRDQPKGAARHFLSSRTKLPGPRMARVRRSRTTLVGEHPRKTMTDGTGFGLGQQAEDGHGQHFLWRNQAQPIAALGHGRKRGRDGPPTSLTGVPLPPFQMGAPLV